MINQEILAGLKHATSRGESLQQAMSTFHNAGYPEKEIEEAARALKIDQAAQGMPQNIKPVTTKKVQAPIKKVEPQPTKKVSAYEEPKEKESIFKKKWFIILLVLFLVLLVGVLGGLFFFRDFFTKLFV